MAEKFFNVSFTVSCKNMRCEPSESKCARCIKSVIDEDIRKMTSYRCTTLTTPNHSKKFGVSFTAVCKRPDCSSSLPRGVACCTANAEKCEMCLRSIVGRGVRSLRGFHVKEIAVV
ncbi:MAG: hypothetical protein ACYC1U_06925 [Candidatus Aquicultorales bacterium]